MRVDQPENETLTLKQVLRVFSLVKVRRVLASRLVFTVAEEQVTPPGCCRVLFPTRLTDRRLLEQSEQLTGPSTMDFSSTFPDFGGGSFNLPLPIRVQTSSEIV